MTLRAALLILQSHQKWRLGDEDAPMTVPSELTEAIGTILQYHVGSTTALIDQVPDVGKMVELSDEDIEKEAQKKFPDMSLPNTASLLKQVWIDGAKSYRNQIKQRQ